MLLKINSRLQHLGHTLNKSAFKTVAFFEEKNTLMVSFYEN